MSRIVASVLVVFCSTIAVLAADTPNAVIADDVALTRATIALLAAKDIAAVRKRLDTTKIPISDQTIGQMANVIGQVEPASIETISSSGLHDIKTGDGFSRVVLEYGLTGKWVVVDAAITSKAGLKQFVRLYLTVNALPLQELNAFHLFGSGPAQYAFLAGWMVAIGLTAWAMIVAFRRHRGWRRWVLIALMPLGLTPTVAMNWITAQIWILETNGGQSIPVFAFRYPMALFAYTETRAPFLYVSAPLIAFGYLIWHWESSRRSRLLASGADVFD